MRFSQRIGKTILTKKIQLDKIDIELRNGLWNSLKINILDPIEKRVNYGSREPEFNFLCKLLWSEFFKQRIDDVPNDAYDKEYIIRKRFLEFEWYEVYDFIEFIVNLDQNEFNVDLSSFKEFCNIILERENSAFRIIDKKIVPITNEIEINEIETAIDNSNTFTAFSGANIHLKTALQKIADKKNPDYRNSIKESISAVESLAKTISENKKDTLAGALDKIKGKTKIHPALEKGFKQIYGYTSDSDGIRHSLMDETNCDFEDAKFMLVSCSSFINYLISKSEKANILLNK